MGDRPVLEIRQRAGERRDDARVAYVLKGFPRRSETFIASEIYRLERLGLTLRLFVLKAPDEPETHPVVERITAVPSYLPQTTSLSASRALPWLLRNVRQFLPALRRTARRSPRGLLAATGIAFAQSIRSRRRFWSTPRKLYLKELLYAVELADRVAADGRIRHLHAHFAHGATTVTWLASRISGVPFSFTGHAKDIYSPDLNPAGLLARKIEAAELVVTCTAANRDHLLGASRSTPVHVVYHGLSSDFTELTAQPLEHVPGRRLRILGVGRLVSKKGFDTFVDACAVLRDAGVPYDAVIAGEAGDAELLVRRRIALHSLAGRVRLLGPLSPEQLFHEYRKASLFSLPCRLLDDGDRDGMPNVLLEAMACATPVVTTWVSGIPELVQDGVNGLLVPPDDPAALAEAWLRVSRDPFLARRLASAGRRTVLEQYDGEALAMRLAALLHTGAHALTGPQR